MLGSGSSVFTATEDFLASLPLLLDLVVQPGQFRARLTWVELPHLHLLRAREALPRIGHVASPRDRVLAVFPMRRASALVCDGATLQYGDMMIYTQGERFSQTTTAATLWGAIWLKCSTLMDHGRVLRGPKLVIPPSGSVLRPAPADWRELLQLHAQAARIAETQLDNITHPEVARALEQDLIWALVNCFAAERLQNRPSIR
jgi:hypothetical protein